MDQQPEESPDDLPRRLKVWPIVTLMVIPMLFVIVLFAWVLYLMYG